MTSHRSHHATPIVMLDALDSDASIRARVQGGAVSIGNFDGLHVGHRELLARTRASADEVGGPAIAVVLDPHPVSLLRPHSAPPILTTIYRRAELMSQAGVNFLVVCPIDLNFLNRSAEDFFEFLIRQRLAAQAMVEGPNFFFGRDRGGDAAVLRQLCEQAAMRLEIVQPTTEGGRMISSSRIREAIAAGQIQTANQMLSSTYQITGCVTRGAGRGHSLGFPTANLTEIKTLVPGHGVYAGRVIGIADDSAASEQGTRDRQNIAAAIHVGPNPTFDDQQRTKVEVHCLDYDSDLYGKKLTIQWIARIRSVQKFESIDALTDQLNRDVQTARRLCSSGSEKQ